VQGQTYVPTVHDGLTGPLNLLDFDGAQSIGYVEYPDSYSGTDLRGLMRRVSERDGDPSAATEPGVRGRAEHQHQRGEHRDEVRDAQDGCHESWGVGRHEEQAG